MHDTPWHDFILFLLILIQNESYSCFGKLKLDGERQKRGLNKKTCTTFPCTRDESDSVHHIIFPQPLEFKATLILFCFCCNLKTNNIGNNDMQLTTTAVTQTNNQMIIVGN